MNPRRTRREWGRSWLYLLWLLPAWLGAPVAEARAQGREYIDIKAPLAKRYVIAVPQLQGPGGPAGDLGAALAAQAEKDLRSSGQLTVLDPATFNAAPIGANPDPARLRSFVDAGCNLVIGGSWQQQGPQLVLDLKLLDPGSGQMLLGKRYRGGMAEGPRMVTQFVNEVILYLSGAPGLPRGRLAFVSGNTDRREIFLLDLGGPPRQLTHFRTLTLSPAWAPNGQEIFFVSYRGGFPALYAVNPATGATRKLQANGTLNVTPAAGPGGLLAATLNRDGDQEIYLLDYQGNIKQRLTSSPGIDIAPTFSPDGRQLAFVSSRQGTPQIYVMPVSGGPARRLTFSGSYNTSPAWSPKGDLIAYAGRAGGSFQIFVIPAQGGTPRQLTREGSNESPTWAPDGHFIACSSTRGGKSAIYIINVQTGAAVKAVDLPGAQTQPSWAPH